VSIILVIDEHGIYRRGLCSFIDTHFPNSRVLEASNCDCLEVGAFVDLILIDSGSVDQRAHRVLAQLNELRGPTRVAVLSSSRTRSAVLNYLSAGFHGFVDKHQSDDDLLAAISDLLSGRIYVPRWLADSEQAQPSAQLAPLATKLTRRQNQVLILLTRGLSNKEISRELKVAGATIKIHTAALLRALGARNRTEAAFMGRNWLDHPADVLKLGWDTITAENFKE
jgi:DNA-binding NarL/FixJ family response regulator